MMSVLWLVVECEPPPPYITTVEDGSFVPPPAPIDVSEARSVGVDSRPRGTSRYKVSKVDASAFSARRSQSPQYTAPPPSDSYAGPIAIASAPSSRYGPPSNGYGPPIAIGTRPSSVYGPPATRRASSSSSSSFSPLAVYSGGQKSSSSASYNERSEPVNYEFQYSVLDVQTGADFGHQEARMGDAAWGAYYVLLPDGRRQVVEYEADQHGYRPKVRYEDARSAGTGAGHHGHGHGHGPY
ncbi:pro-resilin-like isoform X2 [Nilaparvata lugens]|nr:pro-resilin-like isoform X2 [Nilaparvata lugens]